MTETNRLLRIPELRILALQTAVELAQRSGFTDSEDIVAEAAVLEDYLRDGILTATAETVEVAGHEDGDILITVVASKDSSSEEIAAAVRGALG